MPLYEIHHICPLTETQCDELATAITLAHSTKFTTPKLFVNVKFTPTPKDARTYIGGKRRQANAIIANVRVGPSRTQKDWDDLSTEIVNAWKSIVPMPTAKGKTGEDYELRMFFILGGMVGGYEAGFPIPKAGDDVKWLRGYWEEFEMKAKGGDEDFKDLVEEVRERGLMSEKTGKQRLEEELGWGDSA